MRILTEARVRRVYAVVGESFLELLDALQREREITLVSARHDAGVSMRGSRSRAVLVAAGIVAVTAGVAAAGSAFKTAIPSPTTLMVSRSGDAGGSAFRS